MNADIGSISHKLIIVFNSLNNNMSYESNNGSVYYQLSCGIPSVSGVNITTNNGSNYYYLSANDFIIWGQNTTYIHPSANNGSQSYFPVCSAATDPTWNPNDNNGTKFYYNSSFNCVSFCDTP
jgi:hypothetical protein